MIRQWLTVRVAAKRQEATDICSFELADPAGGALPPFSAGAHIDVLVRPDGDLVRQYSLCNNPNERHRYLIAVLRDPNTRGGSQGMHDDIREGDLIRISEPRNHFALASGAARSILLAGGIGVTPILCMAERLAHVGAEFEMHYCTRSRERTAFYDRIRNSEFVDKTVLHFDDGPSAQRFDAARVLAGRAAGCHVYVCGPAGFIDWVLGTARELGWPGDQVHREYFAASAQPAEASGAFEVKIASTGQVVQIPADVPVTTALLEAGIEIPTSCEQGVCGTCLTHVLEGEPDHRDMYLTDAERAQNDQFLPCCSRSKSRVLVLDL